MTENSKISWTDATFNPWEGCARVSEGCRHCYAEVRNGRFHGGRHWGANAPRRMMSESNWDQPIRWNKQAAALGKPRLVFCASLADIYEDREDLIAPRERLFRLMFSTPNLIWLLLTKRPENVLTLSPKQWCDVDTKTAVWWPDNVWVGTTVENQEAADQRLPYLEPFPTRFVSAEPLLGPVDLSYNLERVAADWVIVGGESGRNARPMNPAWAHSIREQCDQARVPFFFKQMGGAARDKGGYLLDGRTYHAWPRQAQAWPT